MAKYIGECWKCETCGRIDNKKPWLCPLCGKETCDYCFSYYGVCHVCCDGKTQEEIKFLAKWEDE